MSLLERLQIILTESPTRSLLSFLAVLNFEPKSELSATVLYKHFLITSLIGSRILDTIRDDELVTARAVSNPPIDNPAENVPKFSLSKQINNAEPGGRSRIQIRLVTAQLARLHARATLKDGSTAIKNIFAFDGAFVSGNTSLVTIRCISSTGSSDVFLFRMHFVVKRLVPLVGSQKMI